MNVEEKAPVSVVPGDPALLAAGDDPPLDLRLFVVMDRAGYVGMLAHGAFVPLFWSIGVLELAYFNVLSVAAWVAAWVLNRRRRQGIAAGLLSVEVVAHAVVATSLLGWWSGFQYYLVPMIPFWLFNPQLRGRMAGLLASTVVALLVLLHFNFSEAGLLVERGYDVGPSLEMIIQYGNMVVPLGTLGIITFHYRTASLAAEARMGQLANRDPLTTLINRRGMLERLGEERNRFERSGAPLTVVMGDIDHFKRVNDVHGHDAGDRVLIEVSRRLKHNLRQQDVVCRWGGEEYLMMLPDTDVSGARHVTERLREAIEAEAVALAAGSQRITMTFGIATLERSMSIQSCVRNADEALYAGKSQGRNCVVVYETPRAVVGDMDATA